MSYLDDTLAKFNSIKDVFGNNSISEYKTSTPFYTQITIHPERKKIYYKPSRNGGRWK